jgi:hypothetical protein
MRKLAVVAIVLSATAACSNQPTATVSPPTRTEAKSATGVLASPAAATAPHPSRSHPGLQGLSLRRCGVEIQLRTQMMRFHAIAFRTVLLPVESI